ncbi:dihydroorotase family protein [Candidatus Bipolaricaulota bacterium]|nr:dihydroorotase family protein [Candidatus Bipolaricaulota bacterium]
MTRRLNLRSSNVYHRGEFRSLAVGIEEGRIAEVGETVGSADEEIELGDKLLLPGAIDAHVHFRDPGNPEKEDFRSGSRAAVRGGVTTVLDMPNNDPPIKSPSLFRKKARIAQEKSLVNFGLYAGIPNDLDLIESIWQEGPIGFKHYMAEEDPDLEDLAEKVDEIGALLTVHAEDKELLDTSRPNNPEEYLESRPPEAEVAAVKKLTSHPPERLHMAHVTLPESVSLIGERATTEITPHHLLLAREDLDLSNFVPVCNPPVRRRSMVEKIQKRFARGEIDIIASDHAPHERREKVTPEPEKGSAGIPGVETILPLSLTYARSNDLPLAFFVEKVTKRPAEVFRLEGRGEIREGYWADLTVVDGSVNRKIRGEKFSSKAKLTPFEGEEVSFWPAMTFVNGELIYREGEIIEEERGKFISGGSRG